MFTLLHLFVLLHLPNIIFCVNVIMCQQLHSNCCNIIVAQETEAEAGLLFVCCAFIGPDALFLSEGQ